MKKSLLNLLLCLALLLMGAAQSHAQLRTITVSGGCISGSVVLTEDGTNFGKPYFSGTGTVGENLGIAITITWSTVNGAWFLRFNGSAYYEYVGDTPLPPNNSTGVWVKIQQNDFCPSGGAVLSVSGSGTQVLTGVPLTLSAPTVTDVKCNGASTGAISITASGGTGPYTYSIGGLTNSTGSFSGLSAGSYTVTVKDANNSTTNSSAITITEPAALTGYLTTKTNLSCSGGSDASYVIFAEGGTKPYTYYFDNMSNTTGIFEGISAGYHTYSTIDACGAVIGNAFTLAEPTPITTSLTSQANVSCFGGSNGSFTVAAGGGTGALIYTLNPINAQNNSGSFTGLSAGSYTVTVEDANGCTTNSASIEVTQPAALTVSLNTQTNAACSGGSTGAISISASGGTPSYTYTLSPGGASNNSGSFTGLSAGSYTVAVKDASGCESAIRDVTVAEPASAVSVSISGNTSVMFGFGENCTTLTASASGGTGPYSYSWSSGGTLANEEVCPGQKAQTYTSTVTDANGCMASRQVTVNVNDVSCGPKNQYVTICYYGVMQCVSEKIAQRYLKLGATVGACGTGNSARISYETEKLPLELSLQAYPNPTSDAVTVRVLAPRTGAATFEVLDVAGRARQSRTEQLVEGLNEVELQLGTLPTGIYLIRVLDALNRQATVRVEKQ